MDKIDLSKTYAAMRSIYRLSEFLNTKSPKILIDTERTILCEYFTQLSAEEILYILKHFNDYQKQQDAQIITEIQEMARYFNNLN